MPCSFSSYRLDYLSRYNFVVKFMLICDTVRNLQIVIIYDRVLVHLIRLGRWLHINCVYGPIQILQLFKVNAVGIKFHKVVLKCLLVYIFCSNYHLVMDRMVLVLAFGHEGRWNLGSATTGGDGSVD